MTIGTISWTAQSLYVLDLQEIKTIGIDNIPRIEE